MNPEEVVRLIEDLAYTNSTKNTDYERKKSVDSLEKGQMAEVKAKLDTVHNLLKKHVSFTKGVETDEAAEKNEFEEDVKNFSKTGFQNWRFGNQQGNINFNDTSERCNFSNNQNSLYQNLYNRNNYNSSFTRNYGASSYKTSVEATQERKLESMIDQAMEGQQKMTVESKDP